MPRLKIGCSGFLYKDWRGVFYPADLPQRRWLNFYTEKFNTVELNVTFYRLPTKEAFDKWHRETPEGFSYSLKGSRFITHIKKLRDVEMPLESFFNVAAPLGKKFEVALWQFPPIFRADPPRLKSFIELLSSYNVRHTFEFRHESWITPKITKLLEGANIAFTMADWPEFIDDLPITADFVYIRRHGEGGSYATSYSAEQLKKDARRIKSYMREGKDVYIYFNNDAFGYAPKNAMELKTLLEKPAKKPKPTKPLKRKR